MELYIDDRNVLVRTHQQYYDKDNPRIEMIIRPVEYRGIFENEKAHKIFNDKCKLCTRHKRNCSILKKANEGRIQPEIDEEYNCSKFKMIK